jgi:putative transposase
MREWQSQSHVRWYCKSHIGFVPKYRRRVLYGQLRRSSGRILRELCQPQGLELVEGHAMPDHVHRCLRMPPNYRVANTVGLLKGKSAMRSHREFLGREQHFTGWHFGARGDCVSTIGLDEQVIARTYATKRTRRSARNGDNSRVFRPFHRSEKGLQALSGVSGGSLDPFIAVRGVFRPFQIITGPLWCTCGESIQCPCRTVSAKLTGLAMTCRASRRNAWCLCSSPACRYFLSGLARDLAQIRRCSV